MHGAQAERKQLRAHEVASSSASSRLASKSQVGKQLDSFSRVAGLQPVEAKLLDSFRTRAVRKQRIT
jgi:hypothetical protein